MSTKIRYGLIGLILLALALRLHDFFFGSFQADEALFASLARLIAVFRDPLLQNQLVDKPPLLFYLQALFYPLLGPVVQAARLPNLIASIFLVPLSFVLTWRLYRQEATSFMVALLIALSPLVIQYSATAYIDPLLITLLTLTLVIVARNSPVNSLRINRTSEQNNGQDQHGSTGAANHDFAPWAAGLVFGLALAAKYQAILYLPLIIGLVLINQWRRRQWLQGFSAFAGVLAILLLWDFAQDGKLSLLGNQWRSIGGLRFIWSYELTGRLDQLMQNWISIFPYPAFMITVVVGTPVFIDSFFRRRNRSAAVDLLLLLFALGYFLLHWLVAIPIWSRYVLLVSPILIILFVRLVVKLARFSTGLVDNRTTTRFAAASLSWLLLAVLLLVALGPAWNARNGDLKLSDYEQLDGSVEGIADFLSESSSGTVLYDHLYSWRWRYFLFDSETYVSWFANVQTLANDLAVFGRDGTPRYIALPNNETAQPIIRAVNDAGFQLESVIVQGLGENADVSLFQIVAGKDN